MNIFVLEWRTKQATSGGGVKSLEDKRAADVEALWNDE